VPNDLHRRGTARRSTPASAGAAEVQLAGLALGLLPAELDQSIFATALPAVVAELAASRAWL
jgi:hypothetical protein